MVNAIAKAFLKEPFRDVSAFGGLPIAVVLVLIAFARTDWLGVTQLVVGLALSYSVIIILRLLFFKRRPDKQQYRNKLQKIDAGSFPSLHALRASLLALILTSWLQHPGMNIIIWIAAFSVLPSRVYRKRHYWADVIVGFVLGILIGYIALAVAPTITSAIFK